MLLSLASSYGTCKELRSHSVIAAATLTPLKADSNDGGKN